MKSEAEIVNEVLLSLGSMPGVRVWRQNTGALENREGRLVRFGVKGSADISGIVSPEGWRLEVECKSSTGTLTPEQRRWLDMIDERGGISFLTRDAQDARAQLDGELNRRRGT